MAALLIMMAGFYVGSVVNVWVALIAFILFAVVLPYNLFLVASIWRHRRSTSITFAVSLTWLTGTMMIWRGVKESPDGDG